MKSLKMKTLEVVAKVGVQSAQVAGGTASWFGYHQPKEPKELKKA